MPEGFLGNILENIPIYMGFLSGIFAALVFLHKKVLKPFIRLKNEYFDVVHKVDLIAEEMIPNGGNSLKDIVHRIEKEVTLSSERYRAIIADDKSAIFETDEKGNCVWVNRTFAKMTQLLPSELMGHGWVNTLAVFDRDRVVANWEKAVKDDREYKDSFSFQTPDGAIIPVTVSSYKMVTRSNETLGYLGICQVLEGEQ